jgi:hypothetical protein
MIAALSAESKRWRTAEKRPRSASSFFLPFHHLNHHEICAQHSPRSLIAQGNEVSTDVYKAMTTMIATLL